MTTKEKYIAIIFTNVSWRDFLQTTDADLRGLLINSVILKTAIPQRQGAARGDKMRFSVSRKCFKLLMNCRTHCVELLSSEMFKILTASEVHFLISIYFKTLVIQKKSSSKYLRQQVSFINSYSLFLKRKLKKRARSISLINKKMVKIFPNRSMRFLL